MASHSKYTDKESSSNVPIKCVEIQSATHAEIIALGDDVFQKNNEKQWQEFNEKLKQHEIELKLTLEEERKAELAKLKVEHDKNIEKLKQHFTMLMDNALREEAERTKHIMDKLATESLEAERLDGQKVLDASLKQARDDFDAEKAEAVMRVVLEHEERQKKKEKEWEAEHNALLEKINKEWEEKFKIQSEEALLQEHETLEYEREVAKKKFDKLLEEAINAAEEKHAAEVAQLNQCIEDKKHERVQLQSRMQSLNDSIDKKNGELKNLMAAFQKFVDQTPGFSPGQSEFVLDLLIPPGFDEFISSSD